MKADKQILEYKKRLFLIEVEKASKNLRVITPKVKFWSHYENHFDRGERAHIHLDQNLICIAEPELERMSEEDIRTTATHEVSHLHHIGHGAEFQNTHGTLELGAWQPPSGTIGALPEDYVRPKEEKEKKQRAIKYKCNECGKKGETKKCKYCGWYFCKEHIKPAEAGFNKLFQEKDTHPCMGYNNYLIKKEKEENEEYKKALGRLCKPKKKREKIKQKNIETMEKNEEELCQTTMKRLKENKTILKKDNKKTNKKKIKGKKRKKFFKKIFKFLKKK